MTLLRLILALAVTAPLAAPVVACATPSPLLSGYGPPGGSDQTVLGSKLLPPASPSSGDPASGPASLRATSGTVPRPVQPPAGAPARRHRSPSQHTAAGAATGRTTPSGPSAPTATPVSRATLPVVTGGHASTGLLPISTHDALAAGLVALLLAGVAASTLAVGRPDPSDGHGPAGS